MNHYLTLNVPAAVQPDLVALKQSFISLSKQFHPDRFGNATEQEQQAALDKCSAINMAYATLSNAQQALAYYLTHRGIITSDEEYKLSADFLMEMMELNETLEFADVATKEKIGAEISALQQTLLEQITAACLQEPIDVASIKEHYYKLKYYKRLAT
jgi:molecular chaperone HscB